MVGNEIMNHPDHEPSMTTGSKADAACLRDAARILRTRSRRRTFSLRVIIRVLELRADRIERTP